MMIFRKMYIVVILIVSVFDSNNIYHPQVFSEECLYKIA